MKTQNPLIGSASGYIGGVIAYDRGGKHCLRSKPLSVRNPRTEAQQYQRIKMQRLMAIGRIASRAFKYSFPNRPINRSGINEFVSQNMDFFEDGGAEGPVPLLEDFITAKGTLQKPTPTAPADFDGNYITVYWSNALGTNGSPDDQIWVLVYDYQAQETRVIQQLDVRSAQQASVYCPVPGGGYLFAVFIWAQNIAAGTASDSIFQEIAD